MAALVERWIKVPEKDIGPVDIETYRHSDMVQVTHMGNSRNSISCENSYILPSQFQVGYTIAI